MGWAAGKGEGKKGVREDDHYRIKHRTVGEIGFSSQDMEQVAEFCELWCSPNAPVTLFCQQCKTAFCKECDLKMHQGKRQKHCRHSLKHQADKQQQCTGEAATVAGSTKSTSHLLIDANEDLLVGKMF